MHCYTLCALPQSSFEPAAVAGYLAQRAVGTCSRCCWAEPAWEPAHPSHWALPSTRPSAARRTGPALRTRVEFSRTVKYSARCCSLRKWSPSSCSPFRRSSFASLPQALCSSAPNSAKAYVSCYSKCFVPRHARFCTVQKLTRSALGS